MDFKTYIYNLRKDLGLSQRELAHKAGISHTEIYRLEKGERDRPGLDTLKKLAPILNVRVEQLLEAAGYIELDAKSGRNKPARDHQEQDYSYRTDDEAAEIPILSKDGGIESGTFDLKKLCEIDFAIRVADHHLTGAGLYKGDLALCSRDTETAGARVLVVERMDQEKKELALILNKQANSFKVCESVPESGYMPESHTIGKVAAVIRNMDWEADKEDEVIQQWLEVGNIAQKNGFTPEQVEWLIKQQAHFIKMNKKKE